MDFEVSPDLLRIFIEDARGHLEALDHALLTLEREGPSPEVAAAVLGPLHTLKGNSGMMGFSGDQGLRPPPGGRVRGACGTAPPPHPGGLRHPLRGRFGPARRGGEGRRRRGARCATCGAEMPALSVVMGEADRAPGPGRAARPVPAPPGAPAGPKPAEQETAGAAPGTGRVVDSQHVAARSSMVRVDFAQLDHLLNLVGELIIYRTKLQDLGRETAQLLGGQGSARELVEAVQHVAGVSTQLQEAIMDIRMLPIRTVFDRFPRLVRDLAQEPGQGGGAHHRGRRHPGGQGHHRRDRRAPRAHDPQQRGPRHREPAGAPGRAARPPSGTILLSAAQESNQVVITIMDDGRGIDPAHGAARRPCRRGSCGPTRR